MITPIVRVEYTNRKPAWKVLDVMHLDGNINLGRHNVFVWVHRDNKIVRDGSVQIKWGWEGQNLDTQPSPPYKCNKQLSSEPSTDIPIFPGMKIFIEIDDLHGTPSDRIFNLTTMFDGENGNSFGHHSFNVHFQLDNTVINPDDNNHNPELTWQEAVAKLDTRIKVLENRT